MIHIYQSTRSSAFHHPKPHESTLYHTWNFVLSTIPRNLYSTPSSSSCILGLLLLLYLLAKQKFSRSRHFPRLTPDALPSACYLLHYQKQDGLRVNMQYGVTFFANGCLVSETSLPKISSVACLGLARPFFQFSFFFFSFLSLGMIVWSRVHSMFSDFFMGCTALGFSTYGRARVVEVEQDCGEWRMIWMGTTGIWNRSID